jgi:hypothetical protein
VNVNFQDLWGFFAWVFAVCMMAGAVSVYQRYNKQRLSLLAIFGEIFVSGFVGVMTFLLCVAFGLITLPPADISRASMASFLCAIAAHSSTRMLALYDHAVARRLGNILGDAEKDGAMTPSEVPPKGDGNET